jgi:hypothetical protein
MSFNLNTKINNLQFQVNGLVAGTVANPLTANLNANNKQITNINTVSSVSGSPLNLTAGASTINCASAVNMVNTLTINNNTVNNGLVVADSAGDTSCFVVDQSGNVGVKVNPATPLTNDFTVNGNTNISGNLTISGSVTGTGIVSNISAGAGLTKTGTSSNPTLSITPVGTAGTYTYPASITTNDKGQITSITSGSAPSGSIKLGAVYLASNQQFPIAPGGGAVINGSFSTQIQNDINNGVPAHPNGVWIIDFSAYTVMWDKPYDTLNNDNISFAWDDGVVVLPIDNLNPPLQGIFTQAPVPFYPPNMYKCSSIGQIYMNPNQLKTYGLNGANTQLRLINNSTTSTLRGGTFPYLALATYYPDGLIP